MKWQRTLALIIERAQTTEGPAAFTMSWRRGGGRSLSAEVLDGAFVARVSKEMVAELKSLDIDAFEARLTDDWHRERHRAARANLLQSSNLTVSLNQAAMGFLVPVAAPNRTTISVNVYRHLYAETAEVVALLPAVLRERGEAAQKKGKLKKRASLEEIRLELEPMPFVEPPEPGEDGNEEGDTETNEPQSVWSTHRNVIFFGPPGTGKSFRLDDLSRRYLKAHDRMVRVTFHPEYSYHDFVGSYRPVVGWLPSTAGFVQHDGQTRHAEPRVYYHFEPGPFARVLVAAINHPDQNWVLVIEEINRGNCAAVFGDIFQLLDRRGERDRPETWGRSEYAIHPVSELATWLDTQVTGDSEVWSNGRLRLPENLFFWATMNTSDQGLFPMDTAFKRRWAMEYMGVKPPPGLATRVPLHARDSEGTPWRQVMVGVNKKIVEHTRTDDRQMGPYFVQPPRGQTLVDTLQFSSKVLSYLWADVFRDEPAKVFRSDIHTYDDLVRRFEKGKHVFRDELLAAMGISVPEVPPAAAGVPRDGALPDSGDAG